MKKRQEQMSIPGLLSRSDPLNVPRFSQGPSLW